MTIASAIRTLVAAPALALTVVGDAGAAARQLLWINNNYGNDVHVYEIGTWKLVRRLALGENPNGISATRDQKTVHISLERLGEPAGELLWINTATFHITHRLKVGPEPHEIECTPDGNWIYVPCGDGHWWVVNGNTKEVVTKIHTGGRPHNTVISPGGKRMYLSPRYSDRVGIVDIEAGHKLIDSIPIDLTIGPPVISGDGERLYHQSAGLLGFQVADIPSRKVVETVRHVVPSENENRRPECHGLAMRPDQTEIWSCNLRHQSVHVHERTSGNHIQIAAIPMNGNPYWVCFSPDAKYAFVSLRPSKLKYKLGIVCCLVVGAAGVFAIVPAAFRHYKRSIAIGRTIRGSLVWGAVWFASAIGFYVYAKGVNGSVAVIDSRTKQLVTHLPAGQSPRRLLVIVVDDNQPASSEPEWSIENNKKLFELREQRLVGRPSEHGSAP